MCFREMSMPRATAVAIVVTTALFSAALAQVPGSLSMPTDQPVVTVSATGAQVYECRAGSGGGLTWTFKEPRADLFVNGQRIGRHYAGPTWEHQDGSTIVGKVATIQPAPENEAIPWLRLSVASRSGTGAFSSVTAIQRVNTRGGTMAGACEQAGSTTDVPYSADYVMLRSSI